MRTDRIHWPCFLTLLGLLPCARDLRSADNQLTTAERQAGWILLFDGQSLNGWITSGGKPSRTPVQAGCLNPHGCGDYMLIHTLNQFTKPNRRPDGSGHKFAIAYVKHPRTAYIGVQDHGSDCWFKNIKLLPRADQPSGKG